MAISEERKSLPTASKMSLESCVFYQTEIHGTVLKQPIRIEYLIKQKLRGLLAGKQDRMDDRRGR